MPTTARHPAEGLLMRAAAALLLGLLVLLQAGCASLDSVRVEVQTFGTWPEGRAAGRYAIDRLPSQANGGAEQDMLEAAARQALEGVGFAPAADTASVDVLVQLGARSTLIADPGYGSGWGIGASSGRGARVSGSVTLGFPIGRSSNGVYFGPPGWPDLAREQREVTLLLLDRASRQVLVELRGRVESRLSMGSLLPTLMTALLDGFPALAAGSRVITVPWQAPR